MTFQNLSPPGRYHILSSNWLCARRLPPSWGCAPSHLPPGGRHCGVPPLSMRTQCPCFRSLFCSVTIPGAGGAVTICWRLPWEIGCGHCPPKLPPGAPRRAGQGSTDYRPAGAKTSAATRRRALPAYYKPISFFTSPKQAMAKSRSSLVRAADIWVRIRSLPLGTTG